MAADPPARFRAHTIAADLNGGYQVLAVDMNGDGRKDILALGYGMKDLIWFEIPGWRRRVIATGLDRMINVAAVQTGADGIPELVVAAGFSMEPAASEGTIWRLKHKGDPRELWSIAEIDRLPTSHRLRTARIGGGAAAVINAPLAGANAAPPDYREKVPIVCYRTGVWKREVLSEHLEGVLHGLAVIDWDGDGYDELLAASFEGIHLFRRDKDGRWSPTQLTRGNTNPWPKGGSSDVAAGRLGGRRFLCAIEPWHGNEVVVYLERDGAWQRTVIDDTLDQGHALLAADLDGDGRDEIIAGYRGKGGSTYLYTAAGQAGTKWTRSVLDAGGMPASSCDVADLNGDGRPDIVCIGGTALKWYENTGDGGV